MSKVNLNSNEIGTLWTQYVQNSLYKQILEYFLATVEDEQTKEIVQAAYQLSDRIIVEITKFFNDSNIPVPEGFSNKDVNLNAKKLFMDPFMIIFLENTFKTGILAHGTSLAVCVRQDVREFLTSTLKDSTQLFNQCIDLAISKALIVRPPHISIQPGIEFIESKKYMSPFGDRPLSTIELTHLFENIKTNTVGEMICMAFAQNTKSDQVKKFMKRGMKISHKHIEVFSKAIQKSYIDVPMGSNSYVTDSTDQVFSDKLTMHFISLLSSAGQGNYSTASTASMRYDLTLTYQRLAVEIALFAKDGAEMMIENGWFEEPPQTPDRKQLINE